MTFDLRDMPNGKKTVNYLNVFIIIKKKEEAISDQKLDSGLLHKTIII